MSRSRVLALFVACLLAGVSFFAGPAEAANRYTVKSNVPKRYWDSFLNNVPRKGQAITPYPVGKDLPSDCSGV